jgi:hypothetical protein
MRPVVNILCERFEGTTPVFLGKGPMNVATGTWNDQPIIEWMTGNPDFKIEQFQEGSKGYYLVFFRNDYELATLCNFSSVDDQVINAVSRGDVDFLLIMPFEYFNSRVDADRTIDLLGFVLSRMQINRDNAAVLVTSSKMYSRETRPSIDLIQIDFFEWMTSRNVEMKSGPNLEKRHYLCLNRYPRTHRYILLGMLWRRDLLQFGHVSCVTPAPLDMQGRDPVDPIYAYLQDATNLPYLRLEGEQDLDIDQKAIFPAHVENSLMHVVTETVFFEDEIFLTEKTFKSLKSGKPFIMVGPSGALAHLHEQGYRTFPEIFDERYDEMPASIEKLKTIVDQIELFTSLPIEEAERRITTIHETLDHNARHFANRNAVERLYQKLVDRRRT